MVRTLSRTGCTFLVAALLLTGCSTVKGNPDALKQRLTTQVPLHSTAAQVIAILDAQKILHSKYQRTEAAGNSIEAEVHNKVPRSLVNPTYDVVFQFDENGRLDSYDVQYLGYVGY